MWYYSPLKSLRNRQNWNCIDQLGAFLESSRALNRLRRGANMKLKSSWKT